MNTHALRLPGLVYLLIAVAIAAVAAGALLLSSGDRAQGASVTPELLAGASNEGKTCGELEGAGQTWTEFKLEKEEGNLSSGSHSDGTLTVTISNFTFGDASFDWTSNIGVDGVVVKDGVDGAHFYRYDPPAESTGDDGLVTPGDEKAISHISFCYDEEEPTPTATTTATATPPAEATPTPAAAVLGETQEPAALPVSGGAPEEAIVSSLYLLLGLAGLALLIGGGTLVAVAVRRRR